ncbi:MAG: L-serine ammonia-lyase, iron-sulfur-dependent, subunit alpha, partial [Clostridia bacterium]|nr:L-serine ammonia-lyase, iron-sulfur-dependent, subunit alpha [Clostridia bacterium]
IEETEYAAEIALEHQLGLTCDPICGYVQIPCIERNAVAAMRALDGAELSHVLAGTRKISFDVIVKTMYETGKDLSERYRETSEGGLAAQYKVS